MARFKLSRRTVLRGMAGGSLVTMALPTLEAMLNNNGTAYADGADLACRFISYFWADGVNIDRFEPAQTGASWSLSEEMAPLAPVKDYINILTGLDSPSTVAITHHEGMTVFNGYNFVNQNGLNSDAGGPTIEQLVADAVAADSTVRAIHVQNSKRNSTDGDGGTTAIAMSHRGTPGNLVAQTPQVNPQVVWQSLFGNFTQPIDTRAPRLRVLDAVREEATALKAKLGTVDNQRIDAHLTALNELQTKIDAVAPACALPSQPTETNTDQGGAEPITAVQQVMSELIAQAFVCDITRVASFMFKRFVSSTVFDEIGAGNIHHSSSHSPGSNNYHNGVVYQMEKLAQLLQVLQSTEDIPGVSNLLDSTIVYASTDCSTPFSHSIARQPIILAGHGRNHLVHPGIHYQATPFDNNDNNPSAAGNTSDALLTCLKAYDPTATSVGGGVAQAGTNVINEVLG
jgi:hypothetical protein